MSELCIPDWIRDNSLLLKNKKIDCKIDDKNITLSLKDEENEEFWNFDTSLILNISQESSEKLVNLYLQWEIPLTIELLKFSKLNNLKLFSNYRDISNIRYHFPNTGYHQYINNISKILNLFTFELLSLEGIFVYVLTFYHGNFCLSKFIDIQCENDDSTVDFVCPENGKKMHLIDFNSFEPDYENLELNFLDFTIHYEDGYLIIQSFNFSVQTCINFRYKIELSYEIAIIFFELFKNVLLELPVSSNITDYDCIIDRLQEIPFVKI